MRAFSLEDYGPLAPVHVGGLSQSFAAHRLSTGQEVRVRQLLPRFRERPETVSRWLRSAERNAAIDHPGCVRVLDYGLLAGEAYAVCERVNGVDLRSVLARVTGAGQRLRTSASVALALHVLDVLAEAQERGISAHLDIEPRSTLVRGDGRLVLTEFGMWEAVETAEAARRRFDLGRVHYLAPELARSQAGDARSDVFSLGAMLYELLTGERPFQAKTQLLVAIAIAEGKRRSLRELAPELPVELVDVVETMMALDPCERFQSARAARNALAAVADVSEVDPANTRSWADLVSGLYAQESVGEASVLPPAPADRVERTVDFDIAAYRARMAGLGAPSTPPLPAASTPEGPPPPPFLSFEPNIAVAPPLHTPEHWAGARLNELLAPPLVPAHGGGGDERLGPPPLVEVPPLAPPSPLRPTSVHAQSEAPASDGRTALFSRRTGHQLAVMAPEPLVALSATAAPELGSPHDTPFFAEPSRPRAVQGWRDPSHTLFQPRRYAKHELGGTRLVAPFWARALLAVLFGFVTVAGAVLLYRLWS